MNKTLNQIFTTEELSVLNKLRAKVKRWLIDFKEGSKEHKQMIQLIDSLHSIEYAYKSIKENYAHYFIKEVREALRSVLNIFRNKDTRISKKKYGQLCEAGILIAYKYIEEF